MRSILERKFYPNQVKSSYNSTNVTFLWIRLIPSASEMSEYNHDAENVLLTKRLPLHLSESDMHLLMNKNLHLLMSQNLHLLMNKNLHLLMSSSSDQSLLCHIRASNVL
ncbi:hypothetical protein QL285_018426 [Trifolium repens]|nr:hypothetical protein QL285_018426 [Trifolium repens]